MAPPRFDLQHTAILVLDMQEKLLPLIVDHEAVTEATARLCRGAMALQAPLLFTEQYRKGLGDTVESLHFARDAAAVCPEKLKFSGCVEDVRNALHTRDLRQVICAGIETHICVLQTCLDLAANGFVTGICVDATGSRRTRDRDAAVGRLVQAGVVPVTVESLLLELVREAGTDRFRAVLPIIKST